MPWCSNPLLLVNENWSGGVYSAISADTVGAARTCKARPLRRVSFQATPGGKAGASIRIHVSCTICRLGRRRTTILDGKGILRENDLFVAAAGSTGACAELCNREDIFVWCASE